MLAGRIAVVVCAGLMLSACEDSTWERLTTFPDYSKQAPQPHTAPPDTPPAQIVSAPPPAPPPVVEGAQAPVMAEPAPAPEMPPPPVVTQPPVPASATSSDYCRLMADSAGKNAATDGFDGAGQQSVMDTTLRQCLSFYGK